jgi:CPA1 family monovalent cation:H+ antiporter
MAAGGIAIGIALGFVVAQVRTRLHDTELEIVISLVTPYLAYVPAERAGVSGVLAVVATGVFLSRRAEGIFLPETRLTALSFWDILTFLLESVLFVLLGAQLRIVVARLGAYSGWTLAWYALVVAAAVVAIRFAFQPGVPAGSWRERLVVGWSGMRGAITLAAALSLPVRFPQRELVLYLAFSVVLATLLVQGISLPFVVRRLGLGRGEEAVRRERDARAALLEAAIARAGELDGEFPDALRDGYASRLQRLQAGDEGRAEHADLAAAQRELIHAQRSELRRIRREGGIDVETARRLQRELDVEELRLGR